MIEKRQRGRPRKGQSVKTEQKYGRSYWSEDEQVFFNDGWAWTIELKETGQKEGGRHWAVIPICLGKEDEILPVLKGRRAIPESYPLRHRALLGQILEYREVNHAGAKQARRRRFIRKRPTGAIRHRQTSSRRSKAR